MVVIDLYSQREAVAAILREMDSPSRIAWLRERGELSEIPTPDPYPSLFLFRSTTGIEAKFFIRDSQMVFLGDHTTIGAVNIEQSPIER